MEHKKIKMTKNNISKKEINAWRNVYYAFKEKFLSNLEVVAAT